MRVYIARNVVPVSAPPIHDGAIAVEHGRISAVGPRAELLAASPPGSDVRDLGDAVLLPGLVNAHTHLELSWAADVAGAADGDFMTWLNRLVELRDGEDEPRSIASAARAIESIVARGTVAVGETANRTWIVGLLRRSPLHAVVFHELFGFRSGDAGAALEGAETRLSAVSEALASGTSAGRVRAVLAPHAPHTCSEGLLRALGRRAAERGEPLSVHAAESLAEVELLRDGGGPLPEFYRSRGVWDDGFQPPGVPPIAHLDRLGLLSRSTLAVHCVRIDEADIARLREREVTVVTCPRSNRCLGVGKAPVPALVAAGVPLAIGTDSLASAPDLDLFGEMQALVEDHPTLAPATVVRMATLGGAEALGLGARLGSLEPGKLAAAAVVRMAHPDDDPLELLCSGPEEVAPLDHAPWGRGAV